MGNDQTPSNQRANLTIGKNSKIDMYNYLYTIIVGCSNEKECIIVLNVMNRYIPS
jgi:hypothetical protein